jgi:aspartokinase
VNDRIECGGVTRRGDLALVEMRGFAPLSGARSEALKRFGEHAIPLSYLVVGWDAEDAENLTLCLNAADLPRAEPLLAMLTNELAPRRVVTSHPVVILTVYGPHFLERYGLANEFIDTLADHQLTVLSICSSVNSVSFVVYAKDEEATVHALSERFAWPE